MIDNILILYQWEWISSNNKKIYFDLMTTIFHNYFILLEKSKLKFSLQKLKESTVSKVLVWLLTYVTLFQEGKKNCYGIGADLRRRYDGFINSSYYYSSIEGRSNSYPRTKETLQLVLAGLFPPTKELQWLEEMNWLPIATYYEEKNLDKVCTK